MPDIYEEIELLEKGHSDLIKRLQGEEKSLLSKLERVQTTLEKLTGKPSVALAEHDKTIDELIPAKKTKGKRTITEAHRQAIIAAQKARWAKKNGKTAATPKEPKIAKKGKRVMSAAAKAKIAAAQKARWAKFHAAKNKK